MNLQYWDFGFDSCTNFLNWQVLPFRLQVNSLDVVVIEPNPNVMNWNHLFAQGNIISRFGMIGGGVDTVVKMDQQAFTVLGLTVINMALLKEKVLN
jgi:hypothetical protein